MSNIKELIVPFLVGGFLISGVKYSSENIKNPAIAAVIAGIPTGLLSIFFLSESKSLKYTNNYFFVTLATLIAVTIFYAVYTYTNISKDFVLLISVIFWFIIIALHTWSSNSKHNLS